MVRHRKERTDTQEAIRDSVLAREDEADILAEVGGERDESGTLIVDEDHVRAIGAVDVESIRANRRSAEFAKKKRDKVPGVTFGSDDVLERYEALLKICEPSMLDISVKCRTGNGPQHMIKSRPRSGAALYEAIRVIHGQREEAEYEVRCLDTGTRQYRLNGGRIVMPDARPLGQQGQPMSQPYYPPQPPQQQPGYAAPPGYPPQAQQSPGADPMAMMRQMFEMFQTMQAQIGAPPSMPQYVPQVAPPVAMPTNPTEMMAEMFRLFQQMQQSSRPVPQPQPQVVAPPAPPAPQIDSPATRMSELREMLEVLRDMQTAMQPPPAPSYRGPRSPYQGAQDRPPPPYYPERSPYPSAPQPAQPPPPPKTAAEQFRDAMSFVRDATNALNEIDTMLPGRVQAESPMEADDDSPVRVIDTGPAKIVVDRTDGSLRLWETGFANAGNMFKWVGEQREAIQKAAAERQRPQQQQPQQLPPGYVEVGPGYQPPPGYVAVRIDHAQQPQDDLPPPPADIPPPLQETPRATWGAPKVPSDPS